MVRTHSERGSEVLEAAIVLPMLIVLAFCLIQVCLIAYEGTAMSAAIESAAMKSDFSAAIASGNVNQAVKDELASEHAGYRQEQHHCDELQGLLFGQVR